MVKKIRSKQAVSEVIGVVLLLGITISLFAILNFSVFHFSFNPSVPSVNLIGTIDKAYNIVNIEHNGGESLEENTEIIITIGNTSYQKSVSELLNDTTADEWNFTKTNSDNKWNFGETVRFHSPEFITNKYIRVTVMDPTTNALVLSIVLQQRSTTSCPAVDTLVDTISPYIISINPFTITAAGDSDLDSVTLYYRWSDDNSSWTGGLNKIYDSVDSNSSNVDSSADTGVETNFPNAQGISRDANVMTIQEANQGGVVNENNNYVDTQSSLHPPTDIGTHTSFAEMQDRDGIYDTLAEANNPPSQVTFQSAGNGAAGTSSSIAPGYPAGLVSNDLMFLHVMVLGTTEAPNTPANWYLLYGPDTTGGSDGRVWVFYKFSTGSESGTLTVSGFGTTAGKFARIYSFRNVALTSFSEGASWGTSTGSTISDAGVTTTGTNELAVNLVAVGEDANSYDSFTGETGGDWTESVAQFSDAAGGDGTLQIQCATMASAGTVNGGSYSMGASDPAGVRGFGLKPINNYRLDLEVGWTTADYAQTNEYLCIYGGTQDSEALQVDVWNGAAWTNVITDLSSGWNNVSVSPYLTSSSFEIRFVDTAQSSDASQSSWQVEGVLLHTWYGLTNYQLDFEYQWTSTPYNKDVETLCMYITSRTGTETLKVNYRNGGSWTSLGTITGTGWKNVTATGLSGSTYTIQLIGATETSDTEQGSWSFDCIFIQTYNTSTVGGWTLWSSVNNPDTSSPWSWDFNFTKGIGYYEFYSIGKEIGNCGGDIEPAPVSADARCRKIP